MIGTPRPERVAGPEHSATRPSSSSHVLVPTERERGDPIVPIHAARLSALVDHRAVTAPYGLAPHGNRKAIALIDGIMDDHGSPSPMNPSNSGSSGCNSRKPSKPRPSCGWMPTWRRSLLPRVINWCPWTRRSSSSRVEFENAGVGRKVAPHYSGQASFVPGAFSSANLAAIVGLRRVSLRMVTSCALSLASRRLRSVPSRASLVFAGGQWTCLSPRSRCGSAWRPGHSSSRTLF